MITIKTHMGAAFGGRTVGLSDSARRGRRAQSRAVDDNRRLKKALFAGKRGAYKGKRASGNDPKRRRASSIFMLTPFEILQTTATIKSGVKPRKYLGQSLGGNANRHSGDYV